jgi:antitoxin StbD
MLNVKLRRRNFFGIVFQERFSVSRSVAASDVQKDFGVWHDRALEEPVQITKQGRETVYLISAETFHQLWASYRRAGSTAELSDAEMALMEAGQLPPECDYDYEDDPTPDADPETQR